MEDSEEAEGVVGRNEMRKEMTRTRCDWSVSHPLLEQYHDEEWGVPIHDERHWFEKLILDTAQAGLSWLTILKKREGYRKAFHNFEPERVARYNERDFERLMNDASIIRNRQKIRSHMNNAKAFLKIQKEFGSFDRYLWDFVGGKPIVNRWRSMKELPARTELSEQLSKDMKKHGFQFVGSTVVYAFMQAGGLVNDHTVDCFRHPKFSVKKKLVRT